jgi:hypothetical protein
MGESSAETSRAKSAKDDGSGTKGEQISQGVAGKTLPEWHEWIVQKNPQGRMGDFMSAVTGSLLTKPQRSHLATIYKNYPGGAKAMMAGICFVAITEPKGDPVSYLRQVAERKRKNFGASEPKEKEFSRDEYVES